MGEIELQAQSERDSARGLRRLILVGTVLVAPFVVFAAFVAVVDPFSYFGLSNVVPDEAKEATSGNLHSPLWKIHKFRQAPTSRILLGDSQLDLNTSSIRSITNDEYFNLTYGGGSLEEAIDTYWLVSETTRLDAVYFGIGLVNVFSPTRSRSRVAEVRAVAANPLIYLWNPVVLHTAFLAAYVAWTGDPVNLSAPSMDRDSFWRFKIESLRKALYRYADVEHVALRLKRVADDCHRRGTRFVIVIPPTHVDLQARAAALGAGADFAQFRRFAATLGTVYDFDYPNEFTTDRSRFSDPYHLEDSESEVLIQGIWGTDRRYSVRTP